MSNIYEVFIFIGVFLSSGSILWSIGISILLHFIFGGHQHLITFSLTARRDIHAAVMLIRQKLMYKFYDSKHMCIPLLWEKTVSKFPRRTAIIEAESGKKLTFDEMNQFSNAFYNVLKENGAEKSDSVALIMPNCVEYGGFWLGASKAGAVSALINTSLQGDQLLHSLKISKSKFIIYHSKFKSNVDQLREKLPETTKFMIFGDPDVNEEKTINLNREFETANRINPEKSVYSNISLADQVLMIFTSGTTGLPKAARIIGYRVHFMGWGPSYLNRWKRGNIFYTSLPLYHASAGGLILGQMMWKGRTVVIRNGFSATKFWDDAVKYDVTVVNYIGEVARFLLNQPYRSNERNHKVKFAVGNGMAPSIWHEFQTRFNVGNIQEFYASTEGNCNLMNSENQPLSVGFLPTGLARRMFPVNIFRVNESSMELVRDANGLCIPVKVGELGMIMGKVRNDVLSRFEGYDALEASQRKIVSNVFSKGDKGFLSGDLLRVDERGWCYFVRRLGDCYRWRGENISAQQVERQVGEDSGLACPIVAIGIELDGYDGTPPVLIINTDYSEETHKKVELGLNKLSKDLHPMFVRFMKNLPMTQTMKIQKTKLKEIGIKPDEDDKIFEWKKDHLEELSL